MMAERLTVSNIPFVLNVCAFELLNRTHDSFMPDELSFEIKGDTVMGTWVVV